MISALVSLKTSVTLTICCVHHLAPAVPPQDVYGQAISHDTISVQWKPPPSEHQHGPILGYKVLYLESESQKTEADAHSVKVTDTRARLTNLEIWTEYKIWVLAFTSAGDSPLSQPISVVTEESGRYPNATMVQCLTSLYQL